MNIIYDTYYNDSGFLYDVDRFKNRQCKAKDIFYIKSVDKNTSYEFVKRYHYLKDAKFFCVQAFGLYYKPTDMLVGCATYSMPQGTATLKGWFGLANQDKSVYELSRLCLLPLLNGTNATSFLLGGSIKMLKKGGNIRAVITLASSDRHVGSIYQICNFKYYGLTDKKFDFYREDGKINPRGRVSQWYGVWMPRSRKHRYAYIIDDTLQCKYSECERPKCDEILPLECCGGKQKVFDRRKNIWYTCPKCTGRLERIHINDEDYQTTA